MKTILSSDNLVAALIPAVILVAIMLVNKYKVEPSYKESQTEMCQKLFGQEYKWHKNPGANTPDVRIICINDNGEVKQK